MTITALPAVPSRSDTPANFVTKADAFMAALPRFGAELNAMGTALNLATTSTSVTSVLIGTGTKTFTVAAGLGYVPGMALSMAYTTTPTNNMFGTVQSYSGTTLIVNVTAINGSGTYTAWSIALAAVAAASSGAGFGANSFTGNQTVAPNAAFRTSVSTLASSATPDIWTNQSNKINYTGTVAATGFAAAPQAGMSVTLVCAAAAQFTASANILIDGYASGQTYTASAGDTVEVLAVATTQFKLKPSRYDGSALSQSQSANIASAATVVLNSVGGDYSHITGTTAITAITLARGAERTVVFDGILTLTNSASLILKSLANITTAVGDTAIFRGEASGVVRCISYDRADGTSIAQLPTGSMTLISSGSLPAATSLTLSSIPQTYKNLVLILKQATGTSGTTVIQPNADATVADYQGYTVNAGTLAALAAASIALDGSTTSAKDHYCTINNYADTGTTKQCISSATNGNGSSTYFTNCIWATLTAISSLKVTRSAAWTGGTYELWGVK